LDRLLVILFFSTLPGFEVILTNLFGFPITKFVIFFLCPLILRNALSTKIPKALITIIALYVVGTLFKIIHFNGEYHRFDNIILLLWIIMVSIVKPSPLTKKLKLVKILTYTLLFLLVIDGIELLQRDFVSVFDRSDAVLYEGLQTFYSYLIFAQMCLLLSGLAIVLIRYKIYIRFNYLILALTPVLVFFSTSRGALIALAFLYIVNFDLFGKKFRWLFGFFVGIAIMSNSIFFDVLSSGFKGLGTKDDLSSFHRLNASKVGIEGFLESPLIGQGWDFVRNIAFIPPHNMPLQLLAELGLIGFCIELSLHILVFFFLKNGTMLKGIHGVYLTFVFWSCYENIGWLYGHRILVVILMLGIIFIKENANSSNVRLSKH